MDGLDVTKLSKAQARILYRLKNGEKLYRIGGCYSSPARAHFGESHVYVRKNDRVNLRSVAILSNEGWLYRREIRRGQRSRFSARDYRYYLSAAAVITLTKAGW